MFVRVSLNVFVCGVCDLMCDGVWLVCCAFVVVCDCVLLLLINECVLVCEVLCDVLWCLCCCVY